MLNFGLYIKHSLAQETVVGKQWHSPPVVFIFSTQPLQFTSPCCWVFFSIHEKLNLKNSECFACVSRNVPTLHKNQIISFESFVAWLM